MKIKLHRETVFGDTVFCRHIRCGSISSVCEEKLREYVDFPAGQRIIYLHLTKRPNRDSFKLLQFRWVVLIDGVQAVYPCEFLLWLRKGYLKGYRYIHGSY